MSQTKHMWKYCLVRDGNFGSSGLGGEESGGGLVPVHHLGFVVVLSSHAQSVCEWTQDGIRGMIYLQISWLAPRFAADLYVSWTRGAGWEQHHPAESLCSLLPHCQPIVSGITPLLPQPHGPQTSLAPDKKTPGSPPMPLLSKVGREGWSLNLNSVKVLNHP